MAKTTNRQSVIRVSSNTGSAAQIAAASQQRRTIVFTPPISGSYTLHTEFGAPSGSGLNVVSGGSHLELTLERHGEIVRKAWFATGSAAMSIGTLETYEESDLVDG